MSPLWRPDWAKVYGYTGVKAQDGDLLPVTRETLRLAAAALKAKMRDDYYHNDGAALREILLTLGEEGQPP